MKVGVLLLALVSRFSRDESLLVFFLTFLCLGRKSEWRMHDLLITIAPCFVLETHVYR